MNVKHFSISRVGPYMDNKNWQAWCRGENGLVIKARGMTAMQALNSLFLEINDDEAGADTETDGTQPLLPSDCDKSTNCS